MNAPVMHYRYRFAMNPEHPGRAYCNGGAGRHQSRDQLTDDIMAVNCKACLRTKAARRAKDLAA